MKRKIASLILAAALCMGLAAPALAMTMENDREGQDLSRFDTYGSVSPLSFSDVKQGDWCSEPVNWAVQQGITNGTSSTTFSPMKDCTQAQILTFLWRAAGEPEPETTGNSYRNPAITADKYYYKALIWAWDKRMPSDAWLDPEAKCKRSDAVRYLWRLADSQLVDTDETPFADVPAGTECAMAVAWAVDAGITNGVSANSFGPDVVCNRGQIVTFLYRYFVEWKPTRVTVSSQEELDALALRADADQIVEVTAVNAGISDISALRALTGLTYLELYFNLDISDLSPLSGLTNLTYLGLSANNISDISALRGLSNLESLDLSANRLTDISVLSGLTNLKKLELTFNSKLTQEQVDALRAQLPGCEIEWWNRVMES